MERLSIIMYQLGKKDPAQEARRLGYKIQIMHNAMIDLEKQIGELRQMVPTTADRRDRKALG